MSNFRDDTLVIKEYTLSQILGWDNTLAASILNTYANDADNFNDILDELIDHEGSDLIDAMFNGSEGSFLESLPALSTKKHN